MGIPYRMTKLTLYRYLVKLRKLEVEIGVRECGRDGWFVRINNHGRLNEIAGICEAVNMRPDDHYKLTDTDYLITLTRIGMDETIQDLFGGAAVGRWIER